MHLLLALALAATPAAARAPLPVRAGSPSLGTVTSAPGAAARAPSLAVVPKAARPGDAVLLRVRGLDAEPRGTLAGRPLTFWRHAAREWRALAAVPLEQPLGPAAAEVTVGDRRLEARVAIVEPGFAARTLTVAPAYVEPPPEVTARIADDRRAFDEAWAQPPSAPLFREDFAWPRTKKAGTTGRFGDQRIFNGKAAAVHYGLDVRGPRGAAITASNDGQVVLTRDAYMSGKSVVLWHGAGVFTVYFHLDRIDVREGTRVRRGQRIGVLGSTGRSTGPHLHWGARVDGLYVDPDSILALGFRQAKARPRVAAKPRATPGATAAGGETRTDVREAALTPAERPAP